MRIQIILVAVGACFIGACATQVGDLRAYGPVWLVTSADLEEAAAACRAGSELCQHVAYVEVISKNELHFYENPHILYSDMRRIRGKWQYNGFAFIEQF